MLLITLLHIYVKFIHDSNLDHFDMKHKWWIIFKTIVNEQMEFEENIQSFVLENAMGNVFCKLAANLLHEKNG